VLREVRSAPRGAKCSRRWAVPAEMPVAALVPLGQPVMPSPVSIWRMDTLYVDASCAKSRGIRRTARQNARGLLKAALNDMLEG
jgi:hypothetical protein